MFWLAVYGVTFLSGANYSHWYHIKGNMDLSSSSYRAVCRLAVRYVSYSILVWAIPVFGLVLQPVGGTQLIDIAGFAFLVCSLFVTNLICRVHVMTMSPFFEWRTVQANDMVSPIKRGNRVVGRQQSIRTKGYFDILNMGVDIDHTVPAQKS